MLREFQNHLHTRRPVIRGSTGPIDVASAIVDNLRGGLSGVAARVCAPPVLRTHSLRSLAHRVGFVEIAQLIEDGGEFTARDGQRVFHPQHLAGKFAARNQTVL